MAFPTLGLIDQFNRAAADPAGAPWNGGVLGYTNALKIASNAITPSTPPAANAYTATTFGGASGVEFYITIVSDIDTFYMMWNTDDPASATRNGYYLRYSAGEVTVFRMDGGTATELDTGTAQSFANGDAIGIKHVGSAIELYRKPSGGSWGATPFATRTDGTYNSGKFALLVTFSTVFDDFGGGTIAAFPTTGLLDNFDRPGENPLGNGTWSGPAVGFVNQLKIHLTIGKALPVSADAGSYWSAAQHGPSFEVYVTILTVDVDGYDAVGWAVSNPGNGSWTGYQAVAHHNLDVVRIYKEATQLGADITGVAFANGDSLGLKYAGGVLTAYRKPSGGSWTSLGSRNESTYQSSTGNLWLGTSESELEDFGGGTIGGAFPTTTVLDNFNRADEDPCSGAGNWVTTAGTILGGFANRLALSGFKVSRGSYCASLWAAAMSGSDQEVFATESGDGNGLIYLFMRAVDPASVDGYMAIFDFTNNLISIYRNDNGTGFKLGGDIAQALGVGDSVGADIVGSDIKVYHKPAAGSWSASLGTRTDSTYTAAGQIALGLSSSTTADDFGGGTKSVGGSSVAAAAQNYARQQ